MTLDQCAHLDTVNFYILNLEEYLSEHLVSEAKSNIKDNNMLRWCPKDKKIKFVFLGDIEKNLLQAPIDERIIGFKMIPLLIHECKQVMNKFISEREIKHVGNTVLEFTQPKSV